MGEKSPETCLEIYLDSSAELSGSTAKCQEGTPEMLVFAIFFFLSNRKWVQSAISVSSTISSPKFPIPETDLSLLEDGNAFIPNLLRQEVDTTQTGQVVDVMAAVVDRIPHPHCTVDGQSNDSDTALECSGQDGSEGVSVAVLTSCSAAPDLWSSCRESEGWDSVTVQQKCTLSFAFSSINTTSSQGRRLNKPLWASQALQLPVANTLFQNGKTSTTMAQQWVLRRESDSRSSFFLSKQKQLPQQTLNMNDLLAEKKMLLNQSLRFNLTQITPARVITAAVGNIIRKIHVCGSSRENTPASEELESAISGEIAKGRVAVQPTGIWALIAPRGHTAGHANSCPDLNRTLQPLEDAIISGCRLHKVLSGGGGWGEKQGLLALDPDSDYLWRRDEFDLDHADDQYTELENFQALGEVVKPGDVVTFYISNPYPLSENAIDSQTGLANLKSPGPLSLMFGSLPSTMDAMPNIMGNAEAVSVQSSCVMIRNHFGMLSEHGLSLKSTFTNFDVRFVRTKLDAPYTLVTIREIVRSSDHGKAEGPGREASQTETQRSEVAKRVAQGFSTIEDSPGYQGAWERNPQEINMRWNQNAALRPTNVDMQQRRPLSTDLRPYSHSQSLIKYGNGPKTERKKQRSVVNALRDDSAQGHLVRKLSTSAPHQKRVLLGNQSNDKPQKGRVIYRAHSGRGSLVRETWTSIEAPNSKYNDQTNMGRVPAKGLHRSLDRPCLIGKGGKGVDDNLDLEQGPPICKLTVAERLVPRSPANIEGNAVPESSVHIRLQGQMDEHAIATGMRVPAQVREQCLLKGQRASRGTRSGKHRVSDEKHAFKAQILPPVGGQITGVSIQDTKAGNATEAEVQVSDEGEDMRTQIQVSTTKGLTRKGNAPYKLQGSKAREAAHLKEPVTHIIDQKAARQARWEARAKTPSRKFRFVTEVPKEAQPASPYPGFVQIRKHFYVGDSSKPRVDEALEKKRPGIRSDMAPYDIGSSSRKTKWNDEIKTDGKVYQINLRPSAKNHSNARDKPESSTDSYPYKTRSSGEWYRGPNIHPRDLSVTPARGGIIRSELGRERSPNRYLIEEHLSKTSASARSRPTSSRDRAQDLHRKYHPQL